MKTTNAPFRNVIMHSPKIVLSLVLGLLCSCPVFAQSTGGSASIHGRIFDADTSRFMQDANISIEGTRLATVSEQGGFYTINNVPEGEVTVVVHFVGYVTEKKTVTVLARGQASLDFDMRLVPSSLSAVPVAPAEGGEKKEDVVLLDKLTVTTERAGAARAFMQQKNSMTLSTVVATDQFGTVQNGNIAEFLRNMPGISVVDNSDTGEGSEISLGGMDPQYTGVFLDGARMASGGGGGFTSAGSDGAGDTRSFRFDQISINGIESIEVRRTVSADMPGDAPAGGVSMKTKSAFDSKTSRTIYNVFVTANSYNMNLNRTPGATDSKSYKILPGFNLTHSTPFNHGTMGLVVDAGYQTDFRETNKATNSIPTNSWSTYNPYIQSVVFRNTQVESSRANASLRWDWKISPYARLSLRGEYNRRETTTFQRNVTFRHNESGKKGNDTQESNLITWLSHGDSSGYSIATQQNGSLENSDSSVGTLTFNWKRYRFTLDAVATWSYAVTKKDYSNDKWFHQISMQGPTKSNNGSGSADTFWGTRDSARSMEWNFYRGDTASLTVNPSQTASMGDITYYGQNGTSAISNPINSDNKQTVPTAKVDLRWDAPTKFPLWFKTGFNYQKTTFNAWQPTDNNGSALANRYQYVGPNLNYGILGGASQASYDRLGTSTVRDGVPLLSSSYFQSNYRFDPRFGGNVASLNIPLINQTLLYSTYKQHPEWFYQNPNNIMNGRIAGYTGRRDLSETNFSGYIMFETRPWPKWAFQAGYRYEFTDQSATTLIPKTKGLVEYETGMSGEAAQRTDKWVDTLYRKGNRTTTTNTYSFLLPSAALKYNFVPNLTAHLGYSEGFGRIGVDKIAGNWKVNDTAQTATAPNPNLTPDHFKTISTAIEYYFEPAGSFTVTYSYRMWDGPNYTSQRASDDLNSPVMQNLVNQYGAETINAFLDSNYTIYTYQPESANNRVMQTLEFSYSQRIPAIPGLKIDANFTRIVPNWRKTGSASAPKLASGGVSYTRGNFYVRASGNWTDRYWTQWNELDNNQQVRTYARILVNAEATYRLTKKIYLYVTANNILNDPVSTYVYSPDIIREETLSGIAFRFGVKNTF